MEPPNHKYGGCPKRLDKIINSIKGEALGVPKLNFDQTYDVNEPTFDKTFDKAEASVIKMEPKVAASPTGGSPIGVVSYFPKDGIKQQPKKPIQFVKKESEGESKFNFNNPPKGTLHFAIIPIKGWTTYDCNNFIMGTKYD